MEVRFKKTPKCKKCGEKDLAKLSVRIVNGRQYFRHLCRKCFNSYTNGRRDGIGMTAAVYARRQGKLKRERKEGSVRLVTGDARKWDRKHGFEPDIDREFVEALVAHGCAYCGTVRERIGLDRKDNTLGHVKSNVVPACTICNLVRGGMPYAAWLVVANGMREARELGLFASWMPGNKGNQGVG